MSVAEYLAVVLVVAVACQWVAWRLKIPSLLLLLLAGFALGQFIVPDELLGREILFAGVNIAVGIILFEGALGLKFSQVRGLGRPITRMCTLTPLIAWVLMSVAGTLLGLDARLAVLIGAILIVTGPTVINPILRQLRPTKRVSQLLMWEGIVVDPIGAVLAVLTYTAIVAPGEGGPLTNTLLALGVAVGISLLLAIVVGWILAYCMRRYWIPDFLQGVIFLAAAVGVLVAANMVQRESGLLAVTLLGIVLANAKDVRVDHIKEFKEHLQVLFVGALFVVLAGRVSPLEIASIAPVALVFVAILIVVVRPVSVWLGLMGTDVARSEKTLVMAMAPRGIVAAAVTSIFALEFHHAAEVVADAAKEASGEAAERLTERAQDLSQLAADADSLVPLVFTVIVVTVAVYGLGIGRLAERLGLATAQPEGVLFGGGAPWAIGAASRLAELDVPTIIVSSDPAEIRAARAAGLRCLRAGILSEHVMEDLDLAGIGYFVAATQDDSTNALAAQEFAHVLGRANCFQLRRSDDDERGSEERQRRTTTSAKLKAQIAFAPALDVDELDMRSGAGCRIARTRLSEQFTLSDFRDEHPEAILLFLRANGKTKVAVEDMPGDIAAGSVIAMVERDTEQEKAKAGEKKAKKAERKAAAQAKAEEQARAEDTPQSPANVGAALRDSASGSPEAGPGGSDEASTAATQARKLAEEDLADVIRRAEDAQDR